MTAAVIIAMAVLIVLMAVLVAGVLRSHAEILRALHNLGIGEDGRPTTALDGRLQPGVPSPRSSTGPASDITGTKPDGAARHVAVAGVDHTTLLAFMSTGCTTCRGFWETFSTAPDLALPGTDTRLVVVTKDLSEESPARLAKLAPSRHPVVMSSSAWAAYGVPVSPYFILVHGPSGAVIGEGAAASWPQVHSLLAQAVADAGMTSRHSPRRGGSDQERHARIDEDLRGAGIEPGDPSLYPTAPPEAQS